MKILLFFILSAIEVKKSLGQGCGYPGSPAHGQVQPSQDIYSFNETVTYSCDENSILIGTSTRDCQLDGTWSGEVPVCSTPLQPLGTPFAAPHDIRYRPELAIDGDKTTCTRTIPRSSRWWRVNLDKTYQVQAIKVTMPIKIDNHMFTLYIVTRNGSKTAYSKCASFRGQFISPSLLIPCSKRKGVKGQIVHIEDNRPQEQEFTICEVEVYVKKDIYSCGDPDREPGSSIIEVTHERATYRCKSGFMLNGRGERRCLPTGHWSGRAPKCLTVNCDLPNFDNEEDDFSYVLLNDTTAIGSMAQVTCDSNENVKAIIKCLPDGKWSKPLINCIKPETQCPKPVTIENGKLDVLPVPGISLTSANIIVYSCNTGYMLLGNPTRVCQNDNTWSGTAPSCFSVNCGLPNFEDEEDDLEYVLLNDTTMFGSVARVTCAINENIKTDIECLPDGKWTELLIKCTYPEGSAVMQSSQPELHFTEATLVALVFAGVLIAIVAVALVVFARKDPTAMTETETPEPKEVVESDPVPNDHQAPVVELPLTTPMMDGEEAPKGKEEVLLRQNDTWPIYDRPSSKVRSLPLPPSRKSSAAGSKENIYEEIGLWARRAQSLSGTLEDNQKENGRTLTSRSMNPELLALYAKVDFEKKRKARLLKEQSMEETKEGPIISNEDSLPFVFRELPPIPTEESSSSEEETTEESSSSPISDFKSQPLSDNHVSNKTLERIPNFKERESSVEEVSSSE